MSDFDYMDQDSIVDSDPWHGYLWERAREAMAHIADEHRLSCGQASPRNNRWRLANIHVGCYCLGVTRLPEPNSRIEVRIKLGEVEFGSEDLDAIAAFAHVTTGREDSSVELPPHDLTSWDGRITRNLSGDVITFGNVPIAQATRRGPIWVYLWLQSNIVPGAESTGTVTQYYDIGMQISTPSPALSSTERAIRFYSDPGGKGVTDAQTGPWFQIGNYLTIFSVLNVFTVPPVRSGDISPSFGTAYRIHEIGVVPVESWTIDVISPVPLPAIEAFRNLRPVSQLTSIPIVNAVMNAAKFRVPVVSGALGRQSGKAWRALTGSAASPSGDQFALVLPDSYVEIDRKIVPNPPPSSNGYEYWIDLVQWLNVPISGTLRIALQVQAYDDSGANIATGPESVLECVVHPTGNRLVSWDSYVVLEHTLWGIKAFTNWQYRGLLCGAGGDWARDVAYVRHYKAEIPEDDLTYPCELALEARMLTTDAAGYYPFAWKVETLIVNSALLARPRALEAGI